MKTPLLGRGVRLEASACGELVLMPKQKSSYAGTQRFLYFPDVHCVIAYDVALSRRSILLSEIGNANRYCFRNYSGISVHFVVNVRQHYQKKRPEKREVSSNCTSSSRRASRRTVSSTSMASLAQGRITSNYCFSCTEICRIQNFTLHETC